MSTPLKELQERALRLPPEERAQLVECILASMEPALHPDWKAEIERRVAAWQRGDVTSIDAGSVFAQARSLGA